MQAEKPTLQPSKRWDARRVKEIKAALKCEAFGFFNDEENKYGTKDEYGSWYIKFCLDSGPYAGQTHIMKLKWIYGTPKDPYEFPACPPLVNFITPIWHTNINSGGGGVCLDTIKDNWSPQSGIEFVFDNIICLLTEPGTDSPYNGAAAKEWVELFKGEKEKTWEGLPKAKKEIYTKICMDYYQKGINAKLTSMIKSKDFTK